MILLLTCTWSTRWAELDRRRCCRSVRVRTPPALLAGRVLRAVGVHELVAGLDVLVERHRARRRWVGRLPLEGGDAVDVGRLRARARCPAAAPAAATCRCRGWVETDRGELPAGVGLVVPVALVDELRDRHRGLAELGGDLAQRLREVVEVLHERVVGLRERSRRGTGRSPEIAVSRRALVGFVTAAPTPTAKTCEPCSLTMSASRRPGASP